jgi:GTPase Era involved in 16S rRNA processing
VKCILSIFLCRLQRSLAVAPWQALKEVDLILFFYCYPNMDRQLPQIRHYLSHMQSMLEKRADIAAEGPIKPLAVSLVCNMIDLAPLPRHLSKIQAMNMTLKKEFPLITICFDISSKTGKNMKNIEHFCTSLAPYRPWLYSPQQTNILSDAQIVLETIREKIYRSLHQEVPYALQHVSITFSIRSVSLSIIHLFL